MRKLRKGDSVIVIAGKDKGKKGEVLKVIDEHKLIVTNVNLVKKHTKPNPNKEETVGDERRYADVIAIRAVETVDFMTAS